MGPVVVAGGRAGKKWKRRRRRLQERRRIEWGRERRSKVGFDNGGGDESSGGGGDDGGVEGGDGWRSSLHQVRSGPPARRRGSVASIKGWRHLPRPPQHYAALSLRSRNFIDLPSIGRYSFHFSPSGDNP